MHAHVRGVGGWVGLNVIHAYTCWVGEGHKFTHNSMGTALTCTVSGMDGCGGEWPDMRVCV